MIAYVAPKTVSWSHGVALWDFVVKHVERVGLGSHRTGFSFGITGTIVVEHEGLTLGGRGTKPCTLFQGSTASV